MRGKGDELQYIVHSTYCIGHRVGEDGFAELGVSNEMFLDVDIPSLHVGY